MRPSTEPEGEACVGSVVDYRLCCLWRHLGGSWTALDERVRQAPGSDEKMAALRGLQRRLLDANGAGPAGLLPRKLPPADLQDALEWLWAPSRLPAPRSPAPRPLAGLATSALVERLVRTAPRMPRPEMEELIDRGEEAVVCLTARLRAGAVAGDALWAIVVLGETRYPAAVPALAGFLGAHAAGIGEAAAEALGKIGAAALPSLATAVASRNRVRRLHAYGALGALRTDDAYRCLAAALERDHVLADVIAQALAAHGRPDAIEPVYAASRRAPAGMRHHLEAAIACLVHGAPAPDPVALDWRVRYRRVPGLGWQFPPGWIGVAALADCERARGGAVRDGHGGGRPLGQIVRDPRLDPRGLPCPSCGGRVWRPTGLAVCRETAAGVVALQMHALEEWIGAGATDVWSALDECDAADVALGVRPARTRTRAWIAIRRATLYWLVAVGCDSLTAAMALLSTIAADLAVLHRVCRAGRDGTRRVERRGARHPTAPRRPPQTPHLPPSNYS